MVNFPEVLSKLNFNLSQTGEFSAIVDDTPELREWLGKGNTGEKTLHTLLGIYDVMWGKIGNWDTEGVGQITVSLVPHVLDDLEDYHHE